MSNLLLNPDVGFWAGLGIWSAGTLVFGIALWLAILLTNVKISFGALSVIVIVSSLTSLVPLVGQFLCFGVAVFLLYRMSDAELGHSALTVLLTRAFVLLIMFGFYFYASKQREQNMERQEKAMQEQIQKMLEDKERKK